MLRGRERELAMSSKRHFLNARFTQNAIRRRYVSSKFLYLIFGCDKRGAQHKSGNDALRRVTI